MEKVRFYLNIEQEEFLRYYQGEANQVVVRSIDDQTIQFPANVLRSHVTREGIHGLFELSFSDMGKFISIRRLPKKQ